MTVDAYEQLSADGIKARVVSMPSLGAVRQAARSYRDEVLPPSVTARVSVRRAPRSAGTAGSARSARSSG